MGQESTSRRCRSNASKYSMHNKIISPEEIISKIDTVQLEDLEKASVEKAGTTWQKRKGNRNIWVWTNNYTSTELYSAFYILMFHSTLDTGDFGLIQLSAAGMSQILQGRRTGWSCREFRIPANRHWRLQTKGRESKTMSGQVWWLWKESSSWLHTNELQYSQRPCWRCIKRRRWNNVWLVQALRYPYLNK